MALWLHFNITYLAPMNTKISKLWIDESGDAGFKFTKGSSRFLVLVAVYIIGTIENEHTVSKSVVKLKEDLKLTKRYEFKFSRCKNEYKNNFLTMLKSIPIQYKAIVVDKKALKNHSLRNNPKQLYAELIRRLLYDNNPPVSEAVVVVDEATVHIHKAEYQKDLKKYLSKTLVKKIVQKRSSTNSMIQVADMLAGSIFRAYEKEDNTYYIKVRKKERILISF